MNYNIELLERHIRICSIVFDMAKSAADAGTFAEGISSDEAPYLK
jgi:hypothetical protein